MHWVDRGPEPADLESVRKRKTPKWISYYRDNTGPKPTDSDWRKFTDELGNRFSHLCGYCEETTQGEVDHFRPKKIFPESVYEWSNWIYACHTCNHRKGDMWPEGGYVDPCAGSEEDKPDKFFTFDLESGFVVPLATLDVGKEKQARQMINDLKLNVRSHVKNRLTWLDLLEETLRTTNLVEWEILWDKFAQPSIQLSSWSAAMLLKYRPSA